MDIRVSGLKGDDGSCLDGQDGRPAEDASSLVGYGHAELFPLVLQMGRIQDIRRIRLSREVIPFLALIHGNLPLIGRERIPDGLHRE